MKIKFKKYPSLSVRDNAAIENFQWKFFHQASGHKSQRYFVVAVSNEEAYPYGVTYADSHLEAREAACHKHAPGAQEDQAEVHHRRRQLSPGALHLQQRHLRPAQRTPCRQGTLEELRTASLPRRGRFAPTCWH